MVLSSVETDESPSWNADFVMDDEHENGRMKEATNELASPIFSLNLASEEMPIEEYVQLVGEKIIDAKYNMSELVDLAWGREIHFGLDLDLDLKEEPMEGNDVDDQPTPIVKLLQAREHAQYLSNFAMQHPQSFQL